MAMPRDETIAESALSVLDQNGVDRLLHKLIAKHHEPRFDIAPELRGALDYSAGSVPKIFSNLSLGLKPRLRTYVVSYATPSTASQRLKRPRRR
jgi:hypothetical protein